MQQVFQERQAQYILTANATMCDPSGCWRGPDGVHSSDRDKITGIKAHEPQNPWVWVPRALEPAWHSPKGKPLKDAQEHKQEVGQAQ